eukprot:Rmarinus@m.8469
MVLELRKRYEPFKAYEEKNVPEEEVKACLERVSSFLGADVTFLGPDYVYQNDDNDLLLSNTGQRVYNWSRRYRSLAFDYMDERARMGITTSPRACFQLGCRPPEIVDAENEYRVKRERAELLRYVKEGPTRDWHSRPEFDRYLRVPPVERRAPYVEEDDDDDAAKRRVVQETEEVKLATLHRIRFNVNRAALDEDDVYEKRQEAVVQIAKRRAPGGSGVASQGYLMAYLQQKQHPHSHLQAPKRSEILLQHTKHHEEKKDTKKVEPKFKTAKLSEIAEDIFNEDTPRLSYDDDDVDTLFDEDEFYGLDSDARVCKREKLRRIAEESTADRKVLGYSGSLEGVLQQEVDPFEDLLSPRSRAKQLARARRASSNESHSLSIRSLRRKHIDVSPPHSGRSDATLSARSGSSATSFVIAGTPRTSRTGAAENTPRLLPSPRASSHVSGVSARASQKSHTVSARPTSAHAASRTSRPGSAHASVPSTRREGPSRPGSGSVSRPGSAAVAAVVSSGGKDSRPVSASQTASARSTASRTNASTVSGAPPDKPKALGLDPYYEEYLSKEPGGVFVFRETISRKKRRAHTLAQLKKEEVETHDTKQKMSRWDLDEENKEFAPEQLQTHTHIQTVGEILKKANDLKRNGRFLDASRVLKEGMAEHSDAKLTVMFRELVHYIRHDRSYHALEFEERGEFEAAMQREQGVAKPKLLEWTCFWDDMLDSLRDLYRNDDEERKNMHDALRYHMPLLRKIFMRYKDLEGLSCGGGTTVLPDGPELHGIVDSPNVQMDLSCLWRLIKNCHLTGDHGQLVHFDYFYVRHEDTKFNSLNPHDPCHRLNIMEMTAVLARIADSMYRGSKSERTLSQRFLKMMDLKIVHSFAADAYVDSTMKLVFSKPVQAFLRRERATMLRLFEFINRTFRRKKSVIDEEQHQKSVKASSGMQLISSLQPPENPSSAEGRRFRLLRLKQVIQLVAATNAHTLFKQGKRAGAIRQNPQLKIKMAVSDEPMLWDELLPFLEASRLIDSNFTELQGKRLFRDILRVNTIYPGRHTKKGTKMMFDEFYEFVVRMAVIKTSFKSKDRDKLRDMLVDFFYDQFYVCCATVVNFRLPEKPLPSELFE